MQVTVKLVNGDTLRSADHDIETVMAEAGMTRAQVEQQLDAMDEVFKNFRAMNHLTVEDVVQGEVYINPANILWVKFTR